MSLHAHDLTALGVDAAVAEAFLSSSTEERTETELRGVRAAGAEILDIRDPRYPQLLLETSDPPLVLWLNGAGWEPERPHIAVVGSRRASAYGLNCAERLAGDLAARGAVIVSGLARGIDSAAHRGALTAGKTVAILGTGVDRVYPRENARLAESIIENGAILSEFPLGTPPLPDHFPRRNRVLAGMTLGTIVVEAAARSGSLITARLALEANREVFAVPGPIRSRLSVGPHTLIRQGACLVSSAEQVIEELPQRVRSQLAGTLDDQHDRAPSLSSTAQRVGGLMSTSESVPLDWLVLQLGLPVARISEALLELDLAGMIRELPGERFLLKM